MLFDPFQPKGWAVEMVSAPWEFLKKGCSKPIRSIPHQPRNLAFSSRCFLKTEDSKSSPPSPSNGNENWLKTKLDALKEQERVKIRCLPRSFGGSSVGGAMCQVFLPLANLRTCYAGRTSHGAVEGERGHRSKDDIIYYIFFLIQLRS